MSEQRRTVSARVRPPSWRDPRLVVGLLLIALAVAGTAALLRGADRTAPVYAAAVPLAVGTVLEEGAVVIAHVRVGEGYVEAGDDAPFGKVLTRPVGAGELIPAGALAARESMDGRAVAVVATVPLAAGVEAGAVVDVWATSEDGGGSERVGEALPVSAVERDERGFGAGAQTVYVTVPAAEVGGLLDALATASEVAVVGLG